MVPEKTHVPMPWRVTEISKRKETGLKAKFLRESVNLNWDFKRNGDFAPITFHGRGYFMELNLFDVLLVRYTLKFLSACTQQSAEGKNYTQN